MRAKLCPVLLIVLLAGCTQTPNELKASKDSITKNYVSSNNPKNIANCVVEKYDENISFGIIGVTPTSVLRDVDGGVNVVTKHEGTTILLTEIRKGRPKTTITLIASGYQMHVYTNSMVESAERSILSCL